MITSSHKDRLIGHTCMSLHSVVLSPNIRMSSSSLRTPWEVPTTSLVTHDFKPKLELHPCDGYILFDSVLTHLYRAIHFGFSSFIFLCFILDWILFNFFFLSLTWFRIKFSVCLTACSFSVSFTPWLNTHNAVGLLLQNVHIYDLLL